MFIRSAVFWHFLPYTQKEVWLRETHPMLLSESSCVCMPSFRPVAPFFFQAKVPFLLVNSSLFFFNTERGVALNIYIF